MSQQLTIRLEPELAAAVAELARRDGISQNRAIEKLVRAATGINPSSAGGPHAAATDLDWFIGSWSPEEADELDRAVGASRTIDAELWR